MGPFRIRHLTAVFLLATSAHAFAAAKARYEIPAQRLDLALLQLGAQSGRQIYFTPDTVRGRISRPLHGEFDLPGALEQMLPDADLTAELRGGAVLIVRAKPKAGPQPRVTVPPRPGSDEAQGGSPHVAELVVTALKYDTLLQKTPTAISYVGVGLAERGEVSLNDFYRRIPGLHLTTNNANQQRLSIRGVRGAGEATTGLYYDETPVTGPAGSAADAGSTQPDLSLFDVQRIEVLRGPQGTLYGAGSMGGTVRVIFNKPDLEKAGGRVELRGGFMEGGDATTSVRAVANMPLVAGKLGARLAVYEERVGGYIDNVRLGRKNTNAGEAKGARATVTVAPTSTLDLTAMVVRHAEDMEDSVGYWYPRLGRHNTDANIVGDYTSAIDLWNVTAHWATPIASLVATSSAYSWKTLQVSDYTATLQRAAADPAACVHFFEQAGACNAAQATAFSAYSRSRIPGAWRQTASLAARSHEIRASSSHGGPIGWTVGVFRENRRDNFDSAVYAAESATGKVLTDGAVTGYRTVSTRVRQTARFGEISLRPTEKLTLIAGARHYVYAKAVGGQVFIPNRITGSDLTPYAETPARDNGVVNKLSVVFEATDSKMVYATRAEGFRPGGANNVPGVGNEVPLTYAPDSLASYELGAKLGFWKGKVTVNSALYRIDWDSMQVSAASTNGAWRFVTNAGRARILGAEIEAIAVPAPGLWLMVNGAFNDARLMEDQRNAVGFGAGVAGDRVPFTPKWTGAVSVVRREPIGAYNTVARFDYTYTGVSASEFRPTAITYQKQPAYGLVDVQLSAERGGLEVSARLTNLFDVSAPLMVATNLSGVRDQTFGARPRALTLGLRKTF